MALGSVVFLLVFAAVMLLVAKLIREDERIERQLNQLAEEKSRPHGLPESEYDVYMMVQAAEAIAYGKYPKFHRLVPSDPEEGEYSGRF